MRKPGRGQGNARSKAGIRRTFALMAGEETGVEERNPMSHCAALAVFYVMLSQSGFICSIPCAGGTFLHDTGKYDN